MTYFFSIYFMTSYHMKEQIQTEISIDLQYLTQKTDLDHKSKIMMTKKKFKAHLMNINKRYAMKLPVVLEEHQPQKFP